MKYIYLLLVLGFLHTSGHGQGADDRYLKQAITFFSKGEYAKADMNCNAALKRNPTSGKAYLLKAKCQYAWDHHRCNWESAQYLDSADKYLENKYDVYIMKVINATCCGKYALAEFYLKRLEKHENKDLQYDFVKSYFLYINRKFDESMIGLDKVISATKDITTMWNAHYYAGYIMYYQRKPEKAISHFKSCLNITPDSREINMMLGASYLMKKDYKTSISYHNKAISTLKDVEEKQGTGICFFYRGMTLLASGNAKKSLKDFYEAKERGKSDADLHYYLGRALMESGDFCSASDHFYETEIKVRDEGEVLRHFHKSNLYFHLVLVNSMAYCDDIKKEHLDLALNLFNEKESVFDRAAIKVLKAAWITQKDESGEVAQICKLIREGLTTNHAEAKKIASKIQKSFCK